MKLIPLSGKYGQGLFTQVDDEDFEYLNQWKWHIQGKGRTKYVVRTIYPEGRLLPKRILMHRLLLNLTESTILVDHIDHDGLNNQRNNLRTCTQRQNIQNGRAYKNTTSLFKGVSAKRISYYYKWVAQICSDKNKEHLGIFPFTPEGETLAAKAYDIAAKKYYGEFANLNFKE